MRPSSLIVFCLFSSTLTRGLGWGLPPGTGWSLALGGVCWRDCGRETPVESLHDRLHISHTVESLVLTKVQNRHIHCGAGRSYQASNKNHGHHQGAAARQTCLVDSADRDPGLASSGATGGRVARRGRSHTSQRMLLPWLSTVQLLHCHSAEANTNTLDSLCPFLTLAPMTSVCVALFRRGWTHPCWETKEATSGCLAARTQPWRVAAVRRSCKGRRASRSPWCSERTPTATETDWNTRQTRYDRYDTNHSSRLDIIIQLTDNSKTVTGNVCSFNHRSLLP